MVMLAMLLGACAAAPPFDTGQVDRSLTPALVTAEGSRVAGRQVLWGGSITKTTNLPASTVVEVQAYPLDSREKPQRDAAPLGCFIVEQNGFLDPLVYASGRLLSVAGTVVRIQADPVGASQQPCPVISSRALYLWPKENPIDGSGIRFGGGIGYGY